MYKNIISDRESTRKKQDAKKNNANTKGCCKEWTVLQDEETNMLLLFQDV